MVFKSPQIFFVRVVQHQIYWNFQNTDESGVDVLRFAVIGFQWKDKLVPRLGSRASFYRQPNTFAQYITGTEKYPEVDMKIDFGDTKVSENC